MRRAAEQRGYFTAAQAREVGYSYQAQKFHLPAPWVSGVNSTPPTFQ
jgi:hypothetical protein